MTPEERSICNKIYVNQKTGSIICTFKENRGMVVREEVIRYTYMTKTSSIKLGIENTGLLVRVIKERYTEVCGLSELIRSYVDKVEDKKNKEDYDAIPF